MKIVRRLLISGKVQGVWYRESMRLEAERLGITGWVRNRTGGTVEALVHGDEKAIETIIAWAWQGPPAAEVSHVEISEERGEYTVFERLPTE